MMYKGICVSLFDYTGVMLSPWRDAGYLCYNFDIQHDPNIQKKRDGMFFCHMDLANELPEFSDSVSGLTRIEFVSAFPPCDHLAVSGARWFKGKGLRKLSESINLFASAAEYCENSGAPYMIENPVSTISTYWRKPDYTFDPYDYAGYESGDNYTKKTCLWVGNGFVMPEPNPLEDAPKPDDRIHKCAPGPERKNIRSATPSGFAKAVFEANHND